MTTLNIDSLEVMKIQKIITQQDKDETTKHKIIIKSKKDDADISITITSEQPLDLIDGQDIDIVLKQKQTRLKQ